MQYLVYVSSATIHFSDEDLKTLLKASRENNVSLGITGMLLYADDNFIQVIEGEKDVLDTLYAKISRDNRHKSFSILIRGEIKERNFADWSMGFKKISKEDFSQIAGFKNLSAKNSQDALTQLNGGPVLLLLKNFLKINAVEGRYIY
ncbi:MAG: BLUF domain-containing protein [Ginsengibacter sp.]